MSEEDWAKIEQVPVYTEKDLANEFEAFSTTLNGTNIDWNKRLKALKRLEGLILGGAYHLGNFPTLLCKLCYQINTQLNDLRSAISKEACSLVCLAAKKGGESLEAFCDKIITKECLLKLINTANKLMADNGHACMITLLEEVKSHKVIPKIIEELSSKSPSVRQKIAEYLFIIMNSYEIPILEKYQALLEGAISSAISDANKDVRQVTRKTFHAYKELFPSRADKMLANFDLSIQKALIDDGLVDSKISPQRKSYGTLNSQTIKSNQRPSSSASGKAANKKVEPSNDQQEFQKTYSTAYTFNLSEKVNSAGIAKKNQKDQSPAKALSKSTLVAEKTSSQPKATEMSSSRYVNGSLKNRLEGNEERVKTANSSPRLNNNKSFNGKEPEYDQNIRAGRSSTPKRLSSSGQKKLSPRMPSMKELGVKQNSTTNEISLLKRNMTDFYQTIKDEDLKFLLEKTNDENWATRSNSFEKVNEFIAELKPDEEIGSPLMNQLILTHIQHINDSHYKVIIACQDSFSRLLTVYCNKILPFMDRIIPLLFINLTDGKEKVSTSTNFVLNLINKIYLGDELFPHFLRSLDYSNKPTYKISVLEFMNVLIKRCKKHFSSQQTVKTCLLKLTTIMHEFNNQKKVLLPCLGMILYLRELDAETTISTLVTLKEPVLSNILSISSEYAPDLDQEIREVKGITRDLSRSLGRKSPSHLKRAKSKQNDSISDSLNKTNLSFANEYKGPKGTTEIDMNTSMMSQSNNERIKNGSYLKLSKESKHTSSNPCLTTANPITKQKIILAETGFQAQTTTAKDQASTWEDGQNVKIMQFDFDDDDNNQSLKPGLSFLNYKNISKSRDDKPDLSNLTGIERAIDQYPKNRDYLQEHLYDMISTLLTHPPTQNMATLERSLEALRKALNLPLDFTPYIGKLISDIISLYHLPTKAQNNIDNVFKIVLSLGSQEDCLAAMLEGLDKEDHPIIQILIKNITNIFLKNSENDLKQFLAVLFDKYYDLINHTNPDVRKNVVFSIVDLHFAHTQEVESFLQNFTPSHQKLIDIYIQKRLEKSKQTANVN